MNHSLPSKFIEAINGCNDVQLDLAFACLKYREIGILRKAKCFAIIFDTNEMDLIESLPKATDGRILDKPSRTMIHDALIERANEQGN